MNSNNLWDTYELHSRGASTSVPSLVHAGGGATVGIPGSLASWTLGAGVHGSWPSLGSGGLLQSGRHNLEEWREEKE